MEEFSYTVWNDIMTIYNGERTVADIGECGDLSKIDLDLLADECLYDLGLIKEDYFSKDL